MMVKHLPSFQHLLTLVALCSAASTYAANPPSAGKPAPFGRAAADEVIVTGWMHVEDHTWRDARVSVEVDGELRVAEVSESGRFDIRLPANTEVVLRFEKPEHLAKEVVINTANARTGEPGRHKRHVKFAVILELERHMAGFSYHSPVGTIGFDEDGGCLAVTHKREKIAPGRNKPMVF